MEHASVIVQKAPSLHDALLIAAFTGWPDAAEVASATVRYLARKLRARRFATFDPEPFHDFTQQRPQAVITNRDQRSIAWPAGEFWAARAEQSGRDLVLLVGPEPQLRWRAYTQALLAVAERTGVTEIMTLGSVFDAVPHTGEPRLAISGSEVAAVEAFHAAGLELSSYEGPTSIHSAVMDLAPRAGIVTLGIWAIAPDYVQAVPNWKVCYALLRRLQQHYGLRVDLEELRAAGRALERRVERALARDPELRAYVQQIQDLTSTASRGLATPGLDAASVLQEVEALLNGRTDDGDDNGADR